MHENKNISNWILYWKEIPLWSAQATQDADTNIYFLCMNHVATILQANYTTVPQLKIDKFVYTYNMEQTPSQLKCDIFTTKHEIFNSLCAI